MQNINGMWTCSKDMVIAMSHTLYSYGLTLVPFYHTEQSTEDLKFFKKTIWKKKIKNAEWLEELAFTTVSCLQGS